MSFIGSEGGNVYAPGYFLAHEECERKTREISQANATTVNGKKYVAAGTFYPANSSSTVEGIVYEDVDVTSGNMPGSVVLKGVVYLDRLPVAPESGVQSALEGKGFTFKTAAPAVVRPEFPSTLTALTVSFAEGSSVGKTAATVSGYTPASTDKYLYKIGTGTAAADAPKVGVGEMLTGWTAWDGSSDITIAAGDDGKYATIAIVTAAGEAIAAGSGAIDRKNS